MAAALPGEFEGLTRYARSVVADPHAADDLVSDTMLRALEKSDSFRGDSALATWLHRILHNLAVDRARSQREVPDDDIATQVEDRWRADDYTVDAAIVVERSEVRELVRDALIRLPYSYRSAVVLHDAEGLTAREIAEITGIGTPAAKQRIRRGRMMLVSALAAGHERRAHLRGVPLSCWEARRHVSEYLDDELALDTKTAVERHLASCPTCPALYTSLVATTEALHTGVARDSDATIPPVLERRLRPS